MSVTNQEELLGAIEDWLKHTEVADRAADFVAFFEASANRTLVPLFEAEETAFIARTAGQGNAPLPADFNGAVYMAWSRSEGKMQYVTPMQLAAIEQECGADEQGPPEYYTIRSQRIYFYPMADRAGNLRLTYRRKIPALTASADTNWFLDEYPDLYLYGALAEAAPYLKDFPAAQAWASAYRQKQMEALSITSQRGLPVDELRIQILD